MYKCLRQLLVLTEFKFLQSTYFLYFKKLFTLLIYILFPKQIEVYDYTFFQLVSSLNIL